MILGKIYKCNFWFWIHSAKGPGSTGISRAFLMAKYCLKIHENERNKLISNKVSGINPFLASPWFFKHYFPAENVPRFRQ